MLALQPVDRLEPLLDRLEPPRLGLDPVEVGAQLRGEVVELDGDGRGALGERIERGVDPADRREPGLRLAPSASLAPPPSSASPLSATSARPAASRRRLGVAQAVALGLELGGLRRVGSRGLDLGELEAQQVEVALAGALALAQLGELARRAACASACAAR